MEVWYEDSINPHYQILEDEGDTLVLKGKQQELLLQQGQIAEPTATLVIRQFI